MFALKGSPLRNLLVLLLVSPLLLMAMVRLLALDRFWPLIPLVAFTPQVTAGLLIALVVALLLRARIAALTIGLVCAGLLFLILPRVIGSDAAPERGRAFTILSANVKLGDAQARPLVRLIDRVSPDVIALQEATPWFFEQLRSAGVTRRYRFTADHTAWGSIGYLTLSRTPLTELPGSGLPGGADGRAWPELRVGGWNLVLRNVHPRPPLTPAATADWRAMLAAIPAPTGRARIVTGDFNATLDHRDLRAVLARGYRDVGELSGNGLDWTWRAGLLRRLVIDHVLIGPGIGAEDYRLFELPGSDHRAVVVKLRL